MKTVDRLAEVDAGDLGAERGMKRRDLELSRGHGRVVAYQNDFMLGQSACPQIHHHPQPEILTSRRGVAAGGGVRAA